MGELQGHASTMPIQMLRVRLRRMPVIISLWRGSETVGDCQALYAKVREASGSGEKVVGIALLAEGYRPPTPATKEYMNREWTAMSKLMASLHLCPDRRTAGDGSADVGVALKNLAISVGARGTTTALAIITHLSGYFSGVRQGELRPSDYHPHTGIDDLASWYADAATVPIGTKSPVHQAAKEEFLQELLAFRRLAGLPPHGR